MKNPNFLSRLKKEGKLSLVETSEEIKESYLEKSFNSLKASQILLESNLLEESISMSYYAMYHCLLALMFKCGIKCENHSGNILLLKTVFGEHGLYGMISKAKEERIDKQYYIDFEISKKDTEALMAEAQKFINRIKLLVERLTKDEIEKIRHKVMNI